jgi:hypothetical protein
MFGVVYKVIQKVVITKHNLINYIYLQIYYRIYIQGLTGGTDQTSGGCSLC